MGRTRVTYQPQPDPASQAQRQAASQAVQQRQIQASQYAAARFQEWAAGAQDREALLNARLQNAQSDAEMNGAQLRYNFWKDQELRNQTTHYYTAMPQLQEQLRQNGIYPGSARYAAEISAFASTIPDALTHNDAIRKDLQGYAKVDEDAARINQMMAAQGISRQQAQMQSSAQDAAAMGQKVSSFSTSSKGVDVKSTRPIDDLQKELKDGHGITRTQFENFDPNSAKVGTLDDKGGLQLNQQGTGNDIQFRVIKDGKAQSVSMPIQEFNKYKTAFGQQPIPLQPVQQVTPSPAPSPSPTPDQTINPSPTPDQIPNANQQPTVTNLGRYNPQTGEFEQ